MNDLIERLSNEADLCRNDGADDIAKLLDEAVAALKPQVMVNGLTEAETDTTPSVAGLVAFEPGTSIHDGAVVFARVMEYQGKRRRDVTSPCMTARECIALANYIHASDRAAKRAG